MDKKWGMDKLNKGQRNLSQQLIHNLYWGKILPPSSEKLKSLSQILKTDFLIFEVALANLD